MHWLKKLVPLSFHEWHWRQLVGREVARRLYEYDRSVFGKEVADRLFPGGIWGKRVYSIELPGFGHPIYFRRGTSDVAVIRQVFGRQEYAAVQGLSDVRLILDCGANIGCTSFFLLHAYPDAHVIVIEPDTANINLCRKNLSPFGNRVTYVQAGIWDTNVPLKVVRGEFRDGEPWSFQVRPCEPDEASDFIGVTIDDLLRKSGRKTIDLLKMDIEGAERIVFSASDVSWLTQTRTIAIELHDDECQKAFHNAIVPLKHELRESGELTICELQSSSSHFTPQLTQC
jgi:FkbM family methyltransferase